MYYFYSICTENPAHDEATIMMKFGDEVHVVKDKFHLVQILTDTGKKSKSNDRLVGVFCDVCGGRHCVKQGVVGAKVGQERELVGEGESVGRVAHEQHGDSPRATPCS